MAELKLDNEFGAALAGAGSRPAFANLIKYRQKDEVVQREFPTTLKLNNVKVQVGANPSDVDPTFRAKCNDSGVACQFRIANEFFRTAPFKPDGGAWAGRGDIQFMLASNCSLFAKVTVQSEPETVFGFARINLTGVGEGTFELTSEVKESEYVTPQDELLGYITVGFTIAPNFELKVSKLENQYDTKNIPALINVISLDSKTLGHRMGTFQSALNILQNIVAEMQRQDAIGAVTGKQLSVILAQASSAQGVELFEDLLWDMASLSFANHIFEPSLAFYPSKPPNEAFFESKSAVGDLFDLGSCPYSLALVTEGQDPVVLAADNEADWLRWSAVLKVAVDANSEANAEKLKKLTVPDYCKDPIHPDHPTAGWLRRKKAQKKALTGDYVRRFFKLECDAENHYSLFYGHEPKDCESDKARTRIVVKEGTRLILPSMLPIPTPFALQIQVQKVSDFSFQGHEELRCVAELGLQRQKTKAINANETTMWGSSLLLPVQQTLLPHANESVTTVNIGWFGEELTLPPKQSDGPPPRLEFMICSGKEKEPSASTSSSGGSNGNSGGSVANDASCVARAAIAFNQLPFGRTQELTLPLEGSAAGTSELTVSVTMRRLGQYKTAWPASKVRLVQSAGGISPMEREEDQWEGPCLVRAAPQGLEVFNASLPTAEPGKPVAVVDYYSIEAVTAVNDSTLDIAVIIESRPGEAAAKKSLGDDVGGTSTPSVSPPPAVGIERRLSFNSPQPQGGHSRSPTRMNMRRSSFGMVSQKGKSLSPPRPQSVRGTTTIVGGKANATGTVNCGNNNNNNGGANGKEAPASDYFILRISPCPAETLKDLVRERKWMFRDRSMLLYMTHKLHQMRLETESPEGTGPVSSDPKTREKLAMASSETYKRIKTNMSEIIKTANWKHARGVGFTEEHIRMFFRLQRLSCYFAKLLESRASPLWGLDDPPDPRKFARQDLDRIFSSQYVQAGTFGAEAQGIENSVKGVGHALKSLHRRMDETKLFYHDQPEKTEEISKVFFQEYFLRCIGELGAHVISDEVLQEVPIEVVVAFVCFLVKRDKAFHELLVDNSLEPDRNAFLTTILSIDSMIRRLTKRTELEIVAQWPKEGDINDDAGPYVASLLGDCSPDQVGKLSTRAPEELMRLLEKYVQLISSQCRARGNLGAKIFEGMFFALPSYASNAADTISRVNHVPCAWNAVRYLSAILNDMSRASTLMGEVLESNKTHLDGIPIRTDAVRAGVFSSGVEVACLVADIALRQMDEVCAEFFQAEWYADEENACMRKTCKLLCRKMDELEGMVHDEPFFKYVVEAGVEKIAFRYLKGFVARATDQSGGKMMASEEVERMKADVDMMDSFLKKYGPGVLTSVYHLREALVFLTEAPEILQQAVFVDILKRHEGKEEYVMTLLKICTAVRDDLRSFYVPAWMNKLRQKMQAIVSERVALEEESDGRSRDVCFDVFEWTFTADLSKPDGGYIYKYLMQCLKNAGQQIHRA